MKPLTVKILAAAGAVLVAAIAIAVAISMNSTTNEPEKDGQSSSTVDGTTNEPSSEPTNAPAPGGSKEPSGRAQYTDEEWAALDINVRASIESEDEHHSHLEGEAAEDVSTPERLERVQAAVTEYFNYDSNESKESRDARLSKYFHPGSNAFSTYPKGAYIEKKDWQGYEGKVNVTSIRKPAVFSGSAMVVDFSAYTTYSGHLNLSVNSNAVEFNDMLVLVSEDFDRPGLFSGILERERVTG